MVNEQRQKLGLRLRADDVKGRAHILILQVKMSQQSSTMKWEAGEKFTVVSTLDPRFSKCFAVSKLLDATAFTSGVKPR